VFSMSDALTSDVRQAIRRISRSPWFAVAVTLVLTLTLSASTALYSLLNGIAIRPIPVPEPDRLYAISRANPRGQIKWMPLGTIAELARHQTGFSDICGYAGGGLFTTEANGNLSTSVFEFVDGHCYAVLGARPLLGRLIGGDDVVVSG